MRKMRLGLSFVVAAVSVLLLVACGDDDSDFATRPSEGSETMTDSRDGQTYKTVTIGTQAWMAENLNYAYTDVPYKVYDYTSDSTSWCYNDDANNCSKYGRLYTWAAAMDSVGTWSTNGKGCGYGTTCSPTYPVRGICPEGWHLPTKADFETLFTAVGGKSIAGQKLKSTTGWTTYSGITNEDAFAFSALPAGYRFNYGGYFSEGNDAYFWSSTEDNSYYAYYMYLDCSIDGANLGNDIKAYGVSVRCLKDTEPAEETTGTMTDSRDGQTYKTVTIGTQTWMAENLNYAYTDVPYKQGNDTSDSTSWCYKGSASYCTKYGRLYTWAAAMDSVGTWSTNGKGCGYGTTCSPTYPVRGVCPEGWHLPTEAEFETLFTAVGGKLTAGKVLKSTTGWTTKSGITNEDAFAFSALPAGYRNIYGRYFSEGYNAAFWSSTENDSFSVYCMFLHYDGGDASLGSSSKNDGFSVRCLKD